MNIIYGVDTSKPINTIMVRDALANCFAEAHCFDTSLDGDTKLSKEYCRNIVLHSFEKTGGDFNNPTKESIIAVMDYLAKFSGKFREKEVIQKHYGEIMNLVNLIK